MRTALRAAWAFALPTIVLVVLLGVLPGRAELLAHLYLVVILALALGLVVHAIHRALPHPGPSAFDEALRRSVPRLERLPALARIEREAALGADRAFDLHFRLRPVLREIAGGLLAVRHGVDLDAQPERARALLGDDAFEVVRPGRPAPLDRYAPGLGREGLERVVVALERL